MQYGGAFIGPGTKRGVHPIRDGTKNENLLFQLCPRVSDYAHACPGGSGVTFMSTDGAGGRVSNSASYCVWFHKFMVGIHCCMGDVWLPNRAIS